MMEKGIDRTDLDLEGSRVLRVGTAHLLLLELASNRGEVVVSIEAPFERVTTTGSIVVDPASPSPELSSIESLVGRAVDTAVIDEGGTLRLHFDDGSTLVAAPSEDFEAWNLTGPAGRIVVSLPGGAIERWT